MNINLFLKGIDDLVFIASMLKVDKIDNFIIYDHFGKICEMTHDLFKLIEEN